MVTGSEEKADLLRLLSIVICDPTKLHIKNTKRESSASKSFAKLSLLYCLGLGKLNHLAY